MTFPNCYDCSLPIYYPTWPADSTHPVQEAFFRCAPHGYTAADEIGSEFDCPDCIPLPDTVPADVAAEEPEMVRAEGDVI